MDTILAADGLTKTFTLAKKEPGLTGTLRHLLHRQTTEVRAVRGVSFTVKRGEIVGFLGANGAGKTTTLKMLSGLLYPTAGSCRVNGHVPFDRAHRFLSDITLVMGNKQQLMWDLPTVDTLRMNAAIYGIPDDVAQARTTELSTMLEMTDKLTTPVRKLSLGERMKAELLASLLHAPSVLFLDEPTLGLDVNAQASVRAFLKSYNAKHQATILLTSHYMQDITALCERVIVIHEGSLVHDGSLDVLSQRFGNTRELHLELLEDLPAERFAAYGVVREQSGRLVRIAVEPKDLVRTVERVLKELPVVDLTVKDAPIEDIVGRVLRGETRA